MRMVKLLSFLVTLYGGMASATARADGEARVVIVNATKTAIRYGFVWGEGKPVFCTLESGQSLLHTCPLDANGQAPRPLIGFPSDNDFHFKAYYLSYYPSPQPPRRFVFRWERDKLDLKNQN